MRFKTANIDVEVKYKTAGNELLVPKPKIVMRSMDGQIVKQVRVVADNRFQWKGKDLQVELRLTDPDTNEKVPESEALEVLKHYGYAFLDEDGNKIEKVKVKGKEVLPVQYFAVQPDGTEKECSPFPRTDVIEVLEENWVPSTSISDFVFGSIYELFADPEEVVDDKSLFEEAERRLKADQVGITNVSWGGFIQHYAFLVPFFKEGKYVWLMKLSTTKTRLNHLQDPPVKVKLPIREAPTLKTLPPVQALVVAAKRKKKP